MSQQRYFCPPWAPQWVLSAVVMGRSNIRKFSWNAINVIWVYNVETIYSIFLQVWIYKLCKDNISTACFWIFHQFFHVIAHCRGYFFFYLVLCWKVRKRPSYPPTVNSNTRAQLCSFPSPASHTVISNMFSNASFMHLTRLPPCLCYKTKQNKILMNGIEYMINREGIIGNGKVKPPTCD